MQIRPLEKFLSIYKGEQRVKMIQTIRIIKKGDERINDDQNEAIQQLKETIMRLQKENKMLYNDNMKLNEIIVGFYALQKSQMYNMKRICKDVLGDE